MVLIESRRYGDMMELRKIVPGSIHIYVALAVLAMSIYPPIGLAVAANAPVAAGQVESLEQVYDKAKKEGRVVVYMATSAKTEEVVFPAFEKRFPGIKITHVNATADQLVARAVAEARGGKIISDVISGTQNYVTQLRERICCSTSPFPRRWLIRRS